MNREHIFIADEKKDEFNTYHTFVIQAEQRDSLQKYLMNQGVETAIHYPIPIHQQSASRNYDFGNYPNTEEQAKRILTLPIHQHLKEQHLIRISREINKFYKR